jgi:hypothetical protein
VSGRLSSNLLEHPRRVQRVASTADMEGLRWAVPEALLVPVPLETGADWVLALGGVFTPEAETVFQAVGETMGLHLSRLAAAHAAAVRTAFEETAATPDRPLELMVMDLLRQVMEEIGAGSGVVTLFDAAGSRRLAAVGAHGSDRAPAATVLTPDRIVYAVTLGGGAHALVELMPAENSRFGDEAGRVIREAASVLQRVLGALGGRGELVPVQTATDNSETARAFVARITEELERAKRFDLGLSMLLIDLASHNVQADTVQNIVASVRTELRRSDVLGFVGAGRIAALLVHTDGAGVGVVVARVRQRLERLLHGKELTSVRLGRGVLSHDCKTASDLLTRASRDAVAVVAN